MGLVEVAVHALCPPRRCPNIGIMSQIQQAPVQSGLPKEGPDDPPSDYEYDVFISYRRHSLVEEWLNEREFFHQLLQNYLAMELGRPARIFRDVVALRPGDEWAAQLERALWTSRCLLTIGTADYFSSAWCAAEFDAFRKRMAVTGSHVIVPLAWHDWNPLPAAASDLQVPSFHDLAFIGAKDDVSLRVPFQRQMKLFTQALAEKIQNAPAFAQTWKPAVPRVDAVRSPHIPHPRG
jgi:hypothetical protein